MKMIRFEELTFPEVADLPRDLRLVMPLGSEEHYDLGALGVEALGLLPALPYGFAPPLKSFDRLIDSVLDTFCQDGFHRPLLLGRDKTHSRLPLPNRPETRVAVVPIGHTEQHGFHLPLSTDTVIIEALATELARLAGDKVHCLPVWPYGVSTHRRQFPGTTSADPRAWEDFWVELVGELRAAGFRSVYLINGHGGNHSFLVNVTKFAGEKWPDMFVATSFLHTSSGEAARELERLRESRIMGHACELETSYLLDLRPDLVHMERVVDEDQFLCTPNYHMDWIGEGALIANPAWTDDTRTGSYGNPSLGTAEKGRVWLEAAARELHVHVDEILEQRAGRALRQAQGWVADAWRSLTP